jgi:hypothetical protein
MKSSPLLAVFFLLPVAACGSKHSSDAPPDDVDPQTFITPQASCAYTCPIDCPEQTAPYACPSMGAWKDIPHDDPCPANFDGKTPEPQKGQCTASAPSGDAAAYAGPLQGGYILPDGRRVRPTGTEWVFNEQDLLGGMTVAALRVPGTNYVLTVDAGGGDHAVRVVDATKFGTASPVVSYIRFASPSTLNSGVVFIPPDLVYVATDDGDVQAIKVDVATGQITKDDARSIKLPGADDPVTGKPTNLYVSGVAASPDHKLLVVTPVADRDLLVYDIAQGSPTFGQKLGTVTLPKEESFGAWFDDADSSHVYVSMWSQKSIVEVDVSTPAAPKITRTFATDKDPEQIAFLDGRWMVVANDLGDTLSLVDRTSGAVRSVAIEAGALPGAEPTSLAWDKAHKRLYVTLSGINAVAAYDVDLAQDPPSITPAGQIATSWWPSGIAVMDDGGLVVTSLRAHGSGPKDTHFSTGADSDIEAQMRGSVQQIPADRASAAADATQIDANNAVGGLAGHPTISCPPGVSDFPVPQTNTEGASKLIDHVFYIVRENKDFDALFGDMPGVEGKADLVLKPGAMDGVWQNVRTLAKTFAMSDNYYTDAVYSTQGHNWTTFGRATDFDERTWAISGSGRDARAIPGGGVAEVGLPVEGSLFDWLLANKVPYDILGEIVGSPRALDPDHPAIDVHYPGGPFQNILYPDVEKACYVAGRARVMCNLGNLVYMTISNDHTGGVGPDKPSPETYCAVNDEATGMVVDAISHSPMWPGSLIVITEDDPSQGGEHIDNHRAPFVIISPWVKRGYVSKTHIDASTAHKLFAHVLGKPYPNRIVANAGLPLDMFTSTPDYTPYTYEPRSVPLSCGDNATSGEKSLTGTWDFTEADEQPGLDAQVMRWMRGEQYEVLPPRVKARAEARVERRIVHGN